MNRKPTHPGKVLKKDVMDSLGLSVTEMAKSLGVSRKQLSLFINERASLSPDMAIRIAEVTGTSAESWMRMQIKLNLWEKAQRKTTIYKEKPIAVNSKMTRDLLEKLEDLYDIQAADEAYAAYLADPETISMDELKKKLDI
ncbi:MAG: HigA family addiction module antidote protein [Bacilli bacterium]|nr:HigA family addiction module antidote protein [Bacilli bacterium]